MPSSKYVPSVVQDANDRAVHERLQSGLIKMPTTAYAVPPATLPAVDEARKKDGHVLSYSRADLKRRGWKQKEIDTVLGSPDAAVENPHDVTWAPMMLWEGGKVRRAEKMLGIVPPFE